MKAQLIFNLAMVDDVCETERVMLLHTFQIQNHSSTRDPNYKSLTFVQHNKNKIYFSETCDSTI